MRCALAMLLAGCSLSLACLAASTATAPTELTLLTIVPGTNQMTIGSSETFTAFAVRSNGSGLQVDPAWTSDNAGVATVSARGLVTAVSAGLATIAATYQSATGSRSLRVLVSFGGNWSGSFRTTACSAGSSSFCTGDRGVGGIGSVALFLTQERDNVTGFVFVETAIPVSGTITIGGSLTLQGGDSIRIENWTSSFDRATQTMTGRFTTLYQDTSKGPPFLPTNRVDRDLVNVKPTSLP